MPLQLPQNLTLCMKHLFESFPYNKKFKGLQNKNLYLWGYGRPIDVVRNSPY